MAFEVPKTHQWDLCVRAEFENSFTQASFEIVLREFWSEKRHQYLSCKGCRLSDVPSENIAKRHRKYSQSYLSSVC